MAFKLARPNTLIIPALNGDKLGFRPILAGGVVCTHSKSLFGNQVLGNTFSRGDSVLRDTNEQVALAGRSLLSEV